MKKMSFIISLLVGTLILVSTAGPVFSAAEREDFSGKRVRTYFNAGTDVKIFACRYNVNNQQALWTVTVDNSLVTGKWSNWDTKVRREIVAYRLSTGDTICDPSEDPPPGVQQVCGTAPCLVTGTGIIFGPFSLIPDSDPTAIWEGMWKMEYKPDGSRFFSAEAKGHGGSLEGRSLHMSTRIPSSTPTGSPVEGWILTPASVK
jgi:hypothetical protein